MNTPCPPEIWVDRSATGPRGRGSVLATDGALVRAVVPLVLCVELLEHAANSNVAHIANAAARVDGFGSRRT